MAGGPGFEPRLTESESAVLPLNYPPPKPLINYSFFGGPANQGRMFFQIGPVAAAYIGPPRGAVYSCKHLQGACGHGDRYACKGKKLPSTSTAQPQPKVCGIRRRYNVKPMLDKLTAMSAAACDGRRAWRTENSRDLYLGVDVQR